MTVGNLLDNFKSDIDKANKSIEESKKVVPDSSLKEEATDIKMVRVIEGKPETTPTSVGFESYMDSTISIFKSAANKKGLSNVNLESLGFVSLFKLPNNVELIVGNDKEKRQYAYFVDDANTQRVIRTINRIVEQNQDKSILKIKMEQEHTIDLNLINSKGKEVKKSLPIISLFATDYDLSVIANLDYVKHCTLWDTSKGIYLQVEYDVVKFNAIPR